MIQLVKNCQSNLTFKMQIYVHLFAWSQWSTLLPRKLVLLASLNDYIGNSKNNNTHTRTNTHGSYYWWRGAKFLKRPLIPLTTSLFIAHRVSLHWIYAIGCPPISLSQSTVITIITTKIYLLKKRNKEKRETPPPPPVLLLLFLFCFVCLFCCCHFGLLFVLLRVQ